MQMDKHHALQDFLDAYDNHAVMVITEAVANAIDIKSTKIRIEFREDIEDGSKWVSFHNNGPAMTERQFNDYHVLARSSKSKGEGIGFAGIGAKVYLAAWDDAVIHTETTDGRTSFASNMYVRQETLKWRRVRPTLDTPGTLYSVRVKDSDYTYMEGLAEDIVTDTFTPALLSGLAVSINGRSVNPWRPPARFRKRVTITSKRKRFPSVITVTEDDIQGDKLGVQYHVSGKVITTKRPDWTAEIKPTYKKRIHAFVNATDISDLLNLNKTSFKSGASTTMRDISAKIYDVLKREGYIEGDSMQKWESNRLTRFFEKLFKDPRYAFLNPDVKGGAGVSGHGSGETSGGTGPGSEDGGSEDEGDRDSTSDGEGPKKTRKRNPRTGGGGSFKIGYVQRADDSRDGWLDMLTNKVIINLEHPLFIKYERNTSARNQRMGAIITATLIKNAASKKEMSPAEAFDLQTNLLTMAKDEMW